MAIMRNWIAIISIASLSIWANNFFVYIVSVLFIAIFQFALGESMLHEASHNNLFTERSWHKKLEIVYGFPFFRTFHSYQKHHLDRHKYL